MPPPSPAASPEPFSWKRRDGLSPTPCCSAIGRGPSSSCAAPATMAATASWRRAICRMPAGPCGSGCSAPAARLKGDAAWAAEALARPRRGALARPSRRATAGGRCVVRRRARASHRGIAGETIDRINSEALTVVAVDVPSGLHGDSGEVMGRAPFAERTVTFFRAKPGHYSVEGLRRCGVLDGGGYRHPGHRAGERSRRSRG